VYEALFAFFLAHAAPLRSFIPRLPRQSCGRYRVEDLLSESVLLGNAEYDAQPFRGWFVGHFVPPELGLRSTPAVEVKWGTHTRGETRADWGSSSTAVSLSLLVSGAIRLFFATGQVALLNTPGDYAVWAPGVAHRWEIEQDDTVVLTVRWPSQPDAI
jgi:hypothetical protein